MPRLKNVKESKNFEDRTQGYNKFIEDRFYKLLMDTDVAYGGRPFNLPPMIRPLDPDRSDPAIYTRNVYDMELTPEEADMMDKGATHKDILLMRAYKRIPRIVGK